MVTGLVQVTATAATEEEAWELACARLLAACRLVPWCDTNTTTERVLAWLRPDRPPGGPPTIR